MQSLYAKYLESMSMLRKNDKHLRANFLPPHGTYLNTARLDTTGVKLQRANEVIGTRTYAPFLTFLKNVNRFPPLASQL